MKLLGLDNKKVKKVSKKDKASRKSVEQAVKTAPNRQSISSSERRYIIKKPLLTEKASILQTAENKYVFLVHSDANKSEIKKEIERLFGVHVRHVNIINQPRKRKVRRGRVGFSSAEKKAIITITDGEKIDILPT